MSSNRFATLHLKGPKAEIKQSFWLGVGFSVVLFLVIALTQMLGEVTQDERDFLESNLAYVTPEDDTLEMEDLLPEDKEEPPPQLEEAAAQLSLEQLDIALNVGSGGSLVGDFSMAALGGSAMDALAESFVDFSVLDERPRPMGVSGMNFPPRLLQKKVSGTIVLLVKLAEDGRVLEVSIEHSDLPDFNRHVVGEVQRWRFTPPMQGGRAVKATARLPIPIQVK